MDAPALLESQVREVVRRQGIDPQREDARLRQAITDVLQGYDDHAAAGRVHPLPDSSAVAKRIHDVLAGLGPLQQYMDDPEVEEIWINRPDHVFVARAGVPELTTTILSDDQVEQLVERMLRTSGRRLDLSSPFVDATLPSGARLHVVIPDVTSEHWAVNIRKFVASAHHISHLVERGSLTAQAATLLDAAVATGLNILVSGATQAGKTTMVRALAGSIRASDRVITVEEVFELALASRDVVAMQCRQPNLEGRGEIPLRRLVKESLRMRPDRIIVGEVREAESLDLLIALNSGVPGMATLHANSAREALVKMCTLPLLAGENVTAQFVVPTVASAIDMVVHLGRDQQGTRRVMEISSVSGRIEQGVVESETLFRFHHGRLERADGSLPHVARFEAAGFDAAQLLRNSREA